jgi:hypothetical protein
MRTKQGLYIFIIFAACALWVWSWLDKRSAHRRAARTPLISIQRIQFCYVAIKVAEFDSGQDMRSLLEQVPGNNLNQKVAALMRQHPPLAWAQNNITDQWGHPFVIIWREEAQLEQLAPQLRERKDSLLIWSIGPNGINENGYGDDLVLPTDRDLL